MPRTAWRATPSSRRSACSSSIALDFRCGVRFSRRPLLKLSTTRTVAPRWTSASTSADPMNEAPPVTSVRVFFQFIFGSFAKLCFCRGSRRDKASCSGIQRGTDFFDQKASRRRIALLPALTKYEPRCSSRKSEQRSETNQSYRPGEQSLCGEHWRVQDFYRRDFLRLLHLGKLVLLSQQLIHRLFNLVLPVQVRVGHSQQRKSFNRRRDESLIVRRIGGIPSKLLQLLVQLIDTRSQRFHTYVAIRINLLESAQLGPRGN